MNNELIIKIGASAKDFENELNKVQKKTEALQDQLATAAKVSSVAFVALGGAIAGSVIAASDFEKTFTNVVTQLDKSSFATKSLDKGIADLKKGVIDIGVRSGESFAVLNTGLFDIVSAGIPAEKALETLAAANQLATAGASDTASAVKALVAAYTSYGAAAGSAQEVAEAFFTASKFGVTDVQGLAQEFNKIAGLANTLGISFNEALGSATALTNNGAKPVAQAFNQFEAVLNSVILAQGKLGGESLAVQKAFSLENIQRVGINQALREGTEAYGGNVAAIQKLLGSSNALAAVLSLTGAQAKDVDKIMNGLNDTQARTISFQEALKVKQETLDKATERFKRSFEAAAITLGEKFVPLIIGVADKLSSLAAKFGELSPAQVKFLAFFLGAATAATGFIAAASLLATSFLNIRNAILALNAVFGVGRVTAVAFWGAATLGVSLLLTALPTIISYVKDLVGAFDFKKPKGLEDINTELDRLKEKRDDIANSSTPLMKSFAPARLKELDAEIAKLEELKKKELEVKEVQAGEGPETPKPKAAGAVDPGKVKDEETKKRIALAQLEAEQLRNIRDSVAKEESDFDKRRQENAFAAAEAKKIINDEERALEIENIRLKNEQLLVEEQDYETRRAEQLAIARENQATVNEELNTLEREQKAALRQEDIDALVADSMTKEQIEREYALNKANRKVAEHNQYLRDEMRFGTQYAEINRLINSEQVAMASQAANALIGMQQSKNNTLKSIGKAAGLTQLGIETAQTAMSAYSAMAGIPIVGPALGAAAAAAVIAYGAERASAILAANEGGMVPNIPGAIRGTDSVPASLTPGELVVPAQNFEEVVEATADARAGGGEGSSSAGNVYIQGDFFGEESMIDKLAEKLFEAQRTRNVRLV